MNDHRQFTEEEMKWIKSLQKLLTKQPETIVAYCTGKEIHFYKDALPLNEDGSVDGGVDDEQVRSKNWEAGAY